MIKLKATANVGDAIVLVHNGRTIAQKSGRNVTFEFDATLVGRGPVQLEAIAMTNAAVGKQEEIQPAVASQPLNLLVEGLVSKRKKYENPPKQRRPVVIRSSSPRISPARLGGG